MIHDEKFMVEPERRLPVTEERDVIVAGGGVTGVMAAVAAARAGANTLLVEARSHLGAVATMGLPIQGYCGRDGGQIVAGYAEDFRQRLMKMGGASDFIECEMHNPYVVVDPECVKIVCQQMLQDAGVDILLNTPVVNVLTDENGIKAAVIEGKSGREALCAKVFIDCTGDADLAARAGAEYDLQPSDRLQTNTLNMILSGVDTDKIKECYHSEPEKYKLFELLDKKLIDKAPQYILVGLKDIADAAKAEHPEWADLWNIVCYITHIAPGTVCINSVHVDGKCACDTRDLTDIELLGRAQAQKVLQFYRGYVPGFENARLASTGPWAGIRETRLLKGRKQLTIETIVNGEMPEDTIALGGYPVDIHDPDANQLVFYKVPNYGISYGCMLTDKVDNLLVAGRTVSATHEAMASSRVMAQCMALGQAAGTAAAMAAKAGVTPNDLDINELRENLCAAGQIL